MTRWTGIVVAAPTGPDDEMVSRLPGCLHPIAGRPLVWHAVSQVARADSPPEQVVVVGGPEIPADLFQDIAGPPVRVIRHEQLGGAVAGRREIREDGKYEGRMCKCMRPQPPAL